MYFKSVLIKDYGPISDGMIDFRFNNNGSPVPLILIGRNGSGKSLFLTNLVDALVETKRKAFPLGILEVKDNSFYKVGKKSYIKNGADYSQIEIIIEDENKKSSFADVMVRNIERIKEIPRDLYSKYFSNDEHSGFYKDVVSDIKAGNFNNCSLTYFPIDRYYLPSWYNSNNYNKVNVQTFERNLDSSNNNFIKYNISENIKEWLYRLFLERGQTALLTQNQKIQFLPVYNFIQDKANQILKLILNDNSAHFGTMSRFSSSIPVFMNNNVLEDISLLSSGQMMMLSIFLSILKDFDESRQFGNTKQKVDGICLIDEIDLSLHIEQQLNILPKLIKEFPDVQFIITSHSPFFIKGFKDEFLNNCDIYSLPLCKKIDSIYDFNQFKEAEAAFNDSAEELEKKIKEQQAQIQKLISENESILFVTEGLTDAKYIKFSVENLTFNFSKPLKIADKETNSQGDTKLFNFLVQLSQLKTNAPRILALFDSDNQAIIKMFNGNNFYTFLDKKIYGILLPKPTFRNSGTKFSIEHYFSDEELSFNNDKYRLYRACEFNDYGITPDGTKICKYLTHNKKKVEDQYVLNGSDEQKTILIADNCNVSLSKNDFCDLAIEGKNNFSKIDWNKFKELLNYINEQLKLFD